MVSGSFHPPRRVLMGPGPSDVSPRVLAAMARPTIGHLDPEFIRLMDSIREHLYPRFATDRLPEGMRRVLILHDVEGYTHEEIGELLGVNSGTSKSQLSKARAKMREMLTGLESHGHEQGVEAWGI